MKIDICTTIDDNYTKYCATVMVSILENKAQDDEPVFHIVHGGLKPENIEKLSKLGDVKFYKVDDSLFTPYLRKAKLSWPAATLYRLKLTSILDLDKVIYLDCDIIVTSSLKSYFEQDVEGFALAAVPDVGYLPYMKRLNIPEEYFYFNAGSILMNLKQFRKEGIEEKLFDCLSEIWQEAEFGDQDVLNKTLYKNVKQLDKRYNYIPLLVDMYKTDGFDISKEISVIHFAGMKPWEKAMKGYLREEFWKYYKKSGFVSDAQFEKEYKSFKLWSTKFFQIIYLLKIYPIGFLTRKKALFKEVLRK